MLLLLNSGTRLAAAAFFSLLCLGASLEDGSCLRDASITVDEPHSPAACSIGSADGQPPAAAEPLLDDSVRCRLSGICDGPLPACNGTAVGGAAQQRQDLLACITDDEGRAAAVREAARHAWTGYR